MTNLDSTLKSRDITLPTKVRLVEAMVFPVVMYRCESWTTKKAEHQRIDAFELWCWRRRLRVPWIQPVHPKGNQSWLFIGRTDAEAESPILWPRDAKSWLSGEAPDAGKDWRQEEKGVTEDEIVGWHHRLNGQEFEQAAEDGDGQGSLVCCSPWSRKESDTTERLDWTDPLQYSWASLVAQRVKNVPEMRETWVRSLGWEDPLEKGMATRSSILAWKIPRTEEPGGYSPRGRRELDMTDQLSLSLT